MKTQLEVWGRDEPHTKKTEEKGISEAQKSIRVQKY